MSILILLAVVFAVVYAVKNFKLVSKKSLVKGNDADGNQVEGNEEEGKKFKFKFKVGPFIVASIILGGLLIVINTMEFEVSVIVFVAAAYVLSNVSMDTITEKVYSIFEKLEKNN